jgi:hypothetical protein
MNRRIRQEIADLHPGYAAVVMATGIDSTGLALFGWHVLSAVLLVVAIVAFAVLLLAYAWRAVGYPRRVLADARDPGRAFGYFTIVAALNVVGTRLALDHHLVAGAALGLASVPAWLVLTYAIPGALMVGWSRLYPPSVAIHNSRSCSVCTVRDTSSPARQQVSSSQPRGNATTREAWAALTHQATSRPPASAITTTSLSPAA